MKEKVSSEIVYSASYSNNHNTVDRLVLFDLEKKESKIIFERPRDTQCIGEVKGWDKGVLFSVSCRECYTIDLNSGKLNRIFENIKQGYVKFTSPVNNRLVYAVSCYNNESVNYRGGYDNTGGSLYLFNLKSRKSHLISKTKKRIGCVAFNGRNLAFTQIVDSSNGYSRGSGYEEEMNTQLEHLISLEVDDNSIDRLGDIQPIRKTHVSHMAMNDNGALSYVYNSRVLAGDIGFKWYKPEIIGIDYLSNNKLAVAGRFVTKALLGEDKEYWRGIKILQDNKIVHEIEINDYISSFSVIR